MRRELALETNVAIYFLGSRQFHAGKIARELRRRLTTIVLPDLAVLQVFQHADTERCYRRFCNMVALATDPGEPVFAVGAGMYQMFRLELGGEWIRRTPLYAPQDQQRIFEHAASKTRFKAWHDHQREEAKWLDRDGWWQKDEQARTIALEMFPEVVEHAGTVEAMERWLPQIPKTLYTNMVMEALVPDERQRAKVCARPDQHRALVALAAACMLNGVGAALDPRGWDKYNFLKISKDSWTDARIFCSAAYADVFVTNDGDLTKRAELIKGWGFFPPRVQTPAEALGDLWPLLLK